jgi:hypothetical protein
MSAYRPGDDKSHALEKTQCRILPFHMSAHWSARLLSLPKDFPEQFAPKTDSPVWEKRYIHHEDFALPAVDIQLANPLPG